MWYNPNWLGIVLSEDEFDRKYEKIGQKYWKDERKVIPKDEFSKCLSQEFNIPEYVAESYINIANTFYATDWYTVLDNVMRLMKTKFVHDVFETLKAVGKEPSLENAKNEIDAIRNEFHKEKQ